MKSKAAHKSSEKNQHTNTTSTSEELLKRPFVCSVNNLADLRLHQITVDTQFVNIDNFAWF